MAWHNIGDISGASPVNILHSSEKKKKNIKLLSVTTLVDNNLRYLS